MPIASEDIDQHGLVIGVSPERFREVAMPLLFDHLDAQCEGTIAVNRQARIVWINDKYAEKVGIADPRSVLGKEIEQVLPASRLREVVQNGQPSMLDLMAFGDEHFVVTRIPCATKTAPSSAPWASCSSTVRATCSRSWPSTTSCRPSSPPPSVNWPRPAARATPSPASSAPAPPPAK
ncbi:hypothetical protein D3C78_1341520 [compost metagenome]